MAMRLVREQDEAGDAALALVAGLMVVAPAMIYVVGSNAGGAAQSAFMMGRKDTENTSNLSNRAPLWSELMESVETRPWLGFGYAGFWSRRGWSACRLTRDGSCRMRTTRIWTRGCRWGWLGRCCIRRCCGGRGDGVECVSTRADGGELVSGGAADVDCADEVAESVPLDPYLPTMLAYACIVKMCMAEGSERESDEGRDTRLIVGGGPLPVMETETA